MVDFLQRDFQSKEFWLFFSRDIFKALYTEYLFQRDFQSIEYWIVMDDKSTGYKAVVWICMKLVWELEALPCSLCVYMFVYVCYLIVIIKATYSECVWTKTNSIFNYNLDSHKQWAVMFSDGVTQSQNGTVSEMKLLPAH